MKKGKILAIACVLLMTTNVHAALQSRPGGTPLLTYMSSDLFTSIRRMEMGNDALGLNAEFGVDSTTSEYIEKTDSNNIDIHMCKNTEWGAAAMLSASDYGAGNGNVKEGYNADTMLYDISASTTGNRSGIFGLNAGAAIHEFTTGIIRNSLNIYRSYYIKTAAKRYVDEYEYGTELYDFSRFIPGDATYEFKTFVTNFSDYRFITSSDALFKRGGRGIYSSYTAMGDNSNGAHACVWVGDGI